MKDLTEIIRGAVSPKEAKIPDVFMRIRKHWKEFNKLDPRPTVWSKKEGLDGLCSPELGDDEWDKDKSDVALDELISLMPMTRRQFEQELSAEMQKFLICAVILGIRIGNALGKEDNGS